MQKKYSFDKILKEYNETHIKSYTLPLEVFNVTTFHDIENNVFWVTYSNKDNILKRKKSLNDFIYYHININLDIQKIKNIILSKENKKLNLKIKILPPNKIRYAYLFSNYFTPNGGNLGQSCMRHKEMQKALNFYVKNNVRIVAVVDSSNKIHARALLWDNVKSTKLKNPFTYLDRVYTRSDELLSLFYDLATANQWRRYPNTSVNNMDKSYYKEDIDAAGMCYLPYNDTFRYLYLKNNLLTSNTGSTIVKLFNLSNSYETLDVHNNMAYYPHLDPNRVIEALSNNYVSKKDAVFIKRYDGFVLRTHIANINGDYYSTLDNKIIKTTSDGYVLKENSVTEIFTNNIIDKSKAVKSTKHKGYMHKSNIVYVKDKLYHKGEPDIICFNNKWYHTSECFINYNLEEINKRLEIPILTQKGNKVLVKRPMFFDKNLPKNYMQYLALIWSFCSKNGPEIKKEGDLIPKEHAIIAYNLVYNPALDKIQYQERYFTKKLKFIKLTTGEYIIDSSANRKHLKKFNNKWFIKQEFKLSDKKQLTFAFMGK